MIKVRFHLAAGKHHRHWQVTDADGVHYYNPNEVTLVIVDGYLHNQPNAARKIFDGANKDVCAWIWAKAVNVMPAGSFIPGDLKEIAYNPKNAPYWTGEGGKDIDGSSYKMLVTNGRKVFTIGDCEKQLRVVNS